MRILVTGGSGHLGATVVSQLVREGHQVRVLTRQPAHIAGEQAGLEWIRGDLATGENLASAVSGIETVIHAATHSPIAQRGGFRPLDFFRSPTDVDVRGTRALIQLAVANRVKHFIHISIAGLDHTSSLPYSRVKIAAESLVRASPVPWTIVRATGFYWLLDRLFARMSRGRFALVPARTHMQPVDSDDFARFVVESALEGPAGEREDFAGPEVLTMEQLLETYVSARKRHTHIVRVPLPARIRSAVEAGQVAPCARRGSTTWANWLQTHAAFG